MPLLHLEGGLIQLLDHDGQFVATGNSRQVQSDRRAPNVDAIGWMSGGFVLTLFLTFARIHIPWWPLHPIGYVMNNTYVAHYMWPYFFVVFILIGL